MSHNETVSRDRGHDLNQRRLRGEGVDVTFIIEDKKFPAHRLIVSLYSPYLKTLMSSPEGFKEAGSDEIVLKDMEAVHFNEVLNYIYTGKITIHMNNVFKVVDICSYLQVSDGLVDTCSSFLSKKLATCALDVLFQIWNVAEQYELEKLKAEIIRVLEFRLDEFLSENFLQFLGYEEIREVLGHSALCVENEKRLFDSLVRWCEENADQEDVDKALEVLSLLKIPLLPSAYIRTSLDSYIGEKATRQLEASFKRKAVAPRECNKCIYVFEYTKSATEVLGIREFVQDKLSAPSYAYFDPSLSSPLSQQHQHMLGYFSGLTHRSYFQHYGPHSTSDHQLVSVGNHLLAVGGVRRSTRETVITDRIKIFHASIANWDNLEGIMPRDLVLCGVEAYRDEVYVFGGLTDSHTRNASKTSYANRPTSVSADAFKCHVDNLTGMRNWTTLAPMPRPRVRFSTARVDTLVCVVGDGFCDVYDVEGDRWREARDVPEGFGDFPALAAVGTSLLIFGSRPEEGTNVFRCYETVSGQWRPLAPLAIRQDVRAAFSHNNLVYLLGWQRATQNVIHVYNMLKDSWTLVAQNIPGTVKSGALLRRQVLESKMFYPHKPIKFDPPE